MANVHLLYDNVADLGLYSGGNWFASLPLTNLKTALPTEVARSTGLDEASTTFTIDLLGPRPVSMLALIATNLSNAANLRIRVSNAADLSDPLLDVTIAAFEPNVPWGSMPWGAFPWDGFRQDYQPGGPITFYRHPSTVFGRYLRINISDPNNPAGFVQIGRVFCGEAFVSEINIAYGAGIGFVDESEKEKSAGGAVYWKKKPKFREAVMQFQFLSEPEAWGALYDMQALLGRTGNLLFVYDPTESVTVRLRRTIYGSLTALDKIVTASPSIDYPYSWNLSVEELI